MATQIISEMEFRLKGDYPRDIPISPEVNMDELKAGDSDPFFVTLPIGQVGGKSPNRTVPYDMAEMQSVVEQVMEKRPEGRLGHLKDEERGSRYDLPSLRWLGAKIDDKGKVWGKAYVPPYAVDVRHHLRTALATNSKVGISIYGKADMDVKTGRFVAMRLESIDLVDPERVGIREATAVPVITKEMEDESTNGEKEKTMPAETHEVLFAEYTRIIDQKTIRVKELEDALKAAEGQATVVVTLQEMFDEGTDIVKAVKGLLEEVETLRADNLSNEIETVVAEMVEVEAARPAIRRMLPKDLTSKKEAEKALKGLLEEVDVQEMIQNYVTKLSGPAAAVGGKNNKGQVQRVKIEDTPENRENARNMFGF